MSLKVSGGSEPPKKAIGVAFWQSGHQKISHFLVCKARGNKHEIRIAFLERDKNKLVSPPNRKKLYVYLIGS